MKVLLCVLFVSWATCVIAADEASPEQILLKDFQPRSIYQVPQTTVTKARFPVVDMHSHKPAAPGMHFDDARMDPLLEKCGQLGMPVSIHVADPKWMYEPMDRYNDGLMNAYAWRLDNQQNILSHVELLGTLERAVKKHPRTTFIVCHFGNCCYDLGKLGTLLDKYPNLYADISARYAETAPIPRAAAKFYGKYQDRLLYGTDMGRALAMYQTTFRILETEDEHFYDWQLFTYHWPLSGLGLEDRVLRKVYFENAEKILKTAKRIE